jgi:hypothetical protein
MKKDQRVVQKLHPQKQIADFKIQTALKNQHTYSATGKKLFLKECCFMPLCSARLSFLL